jgi:hypothetical protein
MFWSIWLFGFVFCNVLEYVVIYLFGFVFLIFLVLDLVI